MVMDSHQSSDQNIVAIELQALTRAIRAQTISLDSNPYKFAAYRAAAYNTVAAATTRLPYDTELYDSNNNFDPATGRFTCTVPGVYYFSASALVTTNASRFFLSLCKNGAEYRRGQDIQTVALNYAANVAGSISLALGDIVEIQYYCDVVRALAVSTSTSFDGILLTKA